VCNAFRSVDRMFIDPRFLYTMNLVIHFVHSLNLTALALDVQDVVPVFGNGAHRAGVGRH